MAGFSAAPGADVYGSSLEMLMLRSALAAGGPVPAIDDHLTLAELGVAHGLIEPARRLYAIAFLRQGFSAQHRIAQTALARRIGWEELAVNTTAPPERPAGGTVDIAIAEVASLARLIGNRVRLNGPENNAASGSDRVIDRSILDPSDAIDRLCAFLRAPATVRPEAADALLARVAAAACATPQFDYRAFHAAPLPLLAAAMSFAGLQQFLLDAVDPAFADRGSAALLHATARLDNAGLGPYLTNVGRIASCSRDVFALAEIAIASSGDAGSREAWVVLLSRALTGPLLNEVVDDLGDSGAMAALGAIFDRAQHHPDSKLDTRLIMRLRDAALDNGDLAFAVRAQDRIVRARPNESLERLILGSIQGTAGMIAAAEQTLVECLRRNPGYGDVTERLYALRARDFARFEVRAGYGSPEDRALRRRVRRTGASVSTAIRSKHPVAVEL